MTKRFNEYSANRAMAESNVKAKGLNDWLALNKAKTTRKK